MTLRLDRAGAHWRAVLDDAPTRNALSGAMVEGLNAALDAVERDPAVRSLTLSGAGGVFCAGADLKGALAHLAEPPGPDDPIRALNRTGGALFRRLDSCPVPVIALVDGPAFGGGFGLVCCADLVIATPAARFSLPETGLGLPPAQIAPYLVARLGPARARRMALFGERLDAAEAETAGLVDILCEADEVEDRRRAALDRIQRGAPHALRITKTLIRGLAGLDREAFVEDAASLFADALRGAEGREGVAAFTERRPPAWVGGAS